MEILESGDPVLQWDRKLSELSEVAETDSLYNTPFSELIDDSALLDVLGQLMGDPFLNDKYEMMDIEENPSSPPPMIKEEHSYSLCGDSRPQSPFTHGSSDDNFSDADLTGEDWCLTGEIPAPQIKREAAIEETPGLAPSVTLTNAALPVLPVTVEMENSSLPQSAPDKAKILSPKPLLPQIKLEPHEVDQFLNLCPKEAPTSDSLQLPPTPPSSHGSDSEGGQSPSRSFPPSSPLQSQSGGKVATRNPSALSNSPLLTAPHKLQGTGPLMLTEEEKRTLIAEGYPIPTKLPLTKAEEKALKKIRRKIKNKISAQESRRKKKEYMDSLEKRVENCSSENSELRKKVEVLETTNRTLLQQLQRLQAMVAGKVSRSCKAASTQTGTCLMVIVLCFAVIFGSFTQNFDLYSSATKTVHEPSRHSAPESYAASIVRSRNLLIFEEHHTMDEIHSSAVTIDAQDAWERHTESIAQHRAAMLEALGQPREKSYAVSNDSIRDSTMRHRYSSEYGHNDTMKVIQLDRRVNATS
ncbi:cyclic AMP-responsive element-binding protein 3-like protein 2 [Bombina bombina]|uniref:cyclic AMP-responsive element-binding protein 3-like protein 2 n=1 Tax=Bombina bombina TaxID=8345 RepID=UPI00235A8330|nr:cyclic AMP-responsive element-binding protein 3-like protein 2 [Bombina bombina]